MIKKQKMGKRIFRTLTVLWMCVIFGFSSRNAVESTEDSWRVGLAVGDVFVPGFEEWNETKQLEFAAQVDHPVRKTAHASEYALLGILIFGSIFGDNPGDRLGGTFGYSGKYAAASWLLGTLYAATDEFHQLFVPGRSGQLSDVCIDSGGVLIGVCIFMIFLYIIQKK